MLFNPYKNALDKPPVRPMISEELNRHGRLGLDGGGD